MLGLPAGDAFEEDPLAAIDELEKLDEEEGESWGTNKVNSPPCELGRALGVPLVWFSPADRRQPGEELRTHEGEYTSCAVCIGARERWGLRSWIVRRPGQSVTAAAGLRTRGEDRVIVRYTSCVGSHLFNIGSPLRPHHTPHSINTHYFITHLLRPHMTVEAFKACRWWEFSLH